MQGWKRLPRIIGRVRLWEWSSKAVGIIVTGTLVATVVLSYLFWDNLRDDMESLSNTLRNVGLLAGGAIAIVLTLWRSVLSERQLEVAHGQVKVAQGQVQIAQKGLLNQRYERATEMLGSPVPVVRLGGVYALSNLAKENPTLYHLPIIELLCAFIRNPTEYENDIAITLANNDPNIRPIIREDIQASLRAIAYRSRAGVEIERRKDFKLDLAKTDLRGVDIGGGDLSRANLREADLSHGVFYKTNLSEANLLGANLAHCYLARVNFRKANLNGTDLSFCYAEFADLSRATVGRQMRAIELGKADLSYSTLLAPDLTSADLRETKLTGAKFTAVSSSKRHISPAGEEHYTDGQIFAVLTQRQLDGAVADPHNPPTIAFGTIDVETGEPLAWRGRAASRGI